MRVEQQRAVSRELADRGDAAISDQRVSARERLRVALARREQGRVVMGVGRG